MDEHFDPYHLWLGIPPTEQPPHHYRLLGLTFGEKSAAVIEGAADRQMAYVRSQAGGKHVEATQRLLNEISAARLVLLDPVKKAAYDDELRARNRVAVAPPLPPTPPPQAPMPVPVAPVFGSGPEAVHRPAFPAPAPFPMSPAAQPVFGEATAHRELQRTEPTYAGPQIIADEPSLSEKVSRQRRSQATATIAVVGCAVVLCLVAAVAIVNVETPTAAVPSSTSPRLSGEETRRMAGVARVERTPAADPTSRGTPITTVEDTPLSFPVTFPATPATREPTGLSIMAATAEATTPATADDDVVVIGPKIDLLRLVQTGRDEVRGPRWTREGSVLVSADAEPAVIEVPYYLPLEYRLTVTATSSRVNSLAIGLVGVDPRSRFLAGMDAVGGRGVRHSGLEMVDGKIVSQTETTRVGPVFTPGQPLRIVCTVQRRRIRVQAGTMTIVDWSGDHERLALHAVARPMYWTPCSLIFAARAQYRISEFTLETLAPSLRAPVPSASEVDSIEQTIQQLFVASWEAAKIPAEKLKVLGLILSAAADPKSGKLERYALWRRVIVWSADANSPATAFQAIYRLSREFEVDSLEEKCRFLASWSEQPGQQDHTAIGRTALTTYEESLSADRYDLAAMCLEIATKAAIKSDDVDGKQICLWRKDELRELMKAKEAAAAALDSLAEGDDSPEHALAAGVYHGFHRDAWRTALPLLARSSDPTLAKLAALDIAEPYDGPAQMALAEAWKAYSVTAADDQQPSALRRAAMWFRLAHVNSSAIGQAQAAAQIRELGIHNLSLAELRRTWRFRDKIFYFYDEPMRWIDAQAWCSARGGNLACFRNRVECDFVSRFANTYGAHDVWIGATDAAREGDWEWVDGSRWTFGNWAKGQPDNNYKKVGEHYVYMFGRPEYQRHWNDFNDVAQLRFVAQWEVDP